MNAKYIVEEIEKRANNMGKYPEYDGLTYKLCKNFTIFYITGLMYKRTYIKYIERVLDVQNKILEYYKYDRMVFIEDRERFFSTIYK